MVVKAEICFWQQSLAKHVPRTGAGSSAWVDERSPASRTGYNIVVMAIIILSCTVVAELGDITRSLKTTVAGIVIQNGERLLYSTLHLQNVNSST